MQTFVWLFSFYMLISKYEAFLYNKETQMIREKNKKKGIKEAKYSSNNLATTIKTIIENSIKKLKVKLMKFITTRQITSVNLAILLQLEKFAVN